MPLGLRVSFIFIFNRLVASFIFILEVCFVAACAYLLALWCDVAASMNLHIEYPSDQFQPAFRETKIFYSNHSLSPYYSSTATKNKIRQT